MKYSWSCYLCKFDPHCRHTWSLHPDKVLDNQDSHHTGCTALLACTAYTCSPCFHSPLVQESCRQVHMDIWLRYQRTGFPQVCLLVHIHEDNQIGQGCTPRICYNLKIFETICFLSIFFRFFLMLSTLYFIFLFLSKIYLSFKIWKKQRLILALQLFFLVYIYSLFVW